MSPPSIQDTPSDENRPAAGASEAGRSAETGARGNPKPVFAGDTRQPGEHRPVRGDRVELEGEVFCRISEYDRLRPFFMTLVSDTDLWLFLSSLGPLTAGRRNAEHALFPYTTEDKIHDARTVTGSRTLLLVEGKDRLLLWEPFDTTARDAYRLERHLYKSVWGNRVFFEETNHDLGLAFRYGWALCDRYGCIKHAHLRNLTSAPVSVRILDGLQNLLPAGVNRFMQTERSNLLDAYKRNELEPQTGLGIFRLSSLPIDRPEPSESLRATTVWSVGLDPKLRLLCTRQVDRFRQGQPVRQETDVRAERGAYWLQADLHLASGEVRDWYLAADVDQGPAEVVALIAALRQPDHLRQHLESALREGTRRLRQIVAQADGLQLSRDRLGNVRHFSNALFNVMRGGLFEDHYEVDRDYLTAFLHKHNTVVAQAHADWLAHAPPCRSHTAWVELASGRGDAQLERLCRECLPLSFSRRHGDPSRPWNQFSIEIRKPDGTRNRYYAGNWRDLFQNWEALARSYPRTVEGMIARFLNASTADGHNPYRITSEGIDWEVLDPSDPWSHIGYWGDHQTIYLLKLLEISRDHHPGALEALLTRDRFAYANVPYRIRPYERLLADPHHTVDYDGAEAGRIAERVQRVGADGKLVWNRTGSVHLVNLTEKLLIWILARLVHFIPGGGIWMNTQRPEWNDANNALVGYGVSMVTLCYLRRAVKFWQRLLTSWSARSAPVAEEVADLLRAVAGALRLHEALAGGAIDDQQRRALLDALGAAGSTFRQRVYTDGFSEHRRAMDREELLSFAEVALAHLDHTIRLNRRDDGLYHAYNLLSVEGASRLALRRLYPMLEGQVAALSTGLLEAAEAVALLDALRSSSLYRADQQSYLLYPDRQLPRFLEANRIPPPAVTQSALLTRLVQAGDSSLVVRDLEGGHHFSGDLHNARDVEATLEHLGNTGYREDVQRDRAAVLALWEQVFQHRSYTGRSGTFYGYEGLGCVYWHMVSKLRLAVFETWQQARAGKAPPDLQERLARHYREIRAGIGVHKNPADYGAFTTDPYSHTPGDGGVRQPGMTGQVKEDLLARWGELGVLVCQGRIRFDPGLLDPEEFLVESASFAYVDVTGTEQSVLLAPHTLAFTFCQVLVVYQLDNREGLKVVRQDGSTQESPGLELDETLSALVFDRAGVVARIEVRLAPARLCAGS